MSLTQREGLALLAVQNHWMLNKGEDQACYDVLIPGGYIDAEGTWRLTPKGHDALAEAQRNHHVVRDLTPRTVASSKSPRRGLPRKAAHHAKGRHRFRRNVARSRKSTPAESFDLTLASYVARLQGQERSNDSLTIEPSKRYTRIVRTSGSVRSVVSFIDRNGDILKPKSWKGPAKGVRGNIYKLT